MMNDDYIEHHGKKGQHWGVLHGPPYPLDRSAEKQARKKAKTEQREKKAAEKEQEKSERKAYKNFIESQKKSQTQKNSEAKYFLSKLTDKELREKVERQELEKRYIELTNSGPSKNTQALKNTVRESMAAAGKMVLTPAFAGLMSLGLNKVSSVIRLPLKVETGALKTFLDSTKNAQTKKDQTKNTDKGSTTTTEQKNKNK